MVDSDRLPRLLTADEVAGILRLHRTTVYRRASAGLLPHLKLDGTIRFEEAAIAALIVGHIVERSAPEPEPEPEPTPLARPTARPRPRSASDRPADWSEEAWGGAVEPTPRRRRRIRT